MEHKRAKALSLQFSVGSVQHQTNRVQASRTVSVDNVLRIPRQNEIRLIGQDTRVADDPRNGIRHEARPGDQAAEGEEASSFHTLAGSMERRAWSRKRGVCHKAQAIRSDCLSHGDVGEPQIKRMSTDNFRLTDISRK